MAGILSLTFDDRNFHGWMNAIPLLQKYHAHATFFISRTIDAEALNCMKELSRYGHSIGLHTLNHADAPAFFAEKGAELYFREQIKPQLDICVKNGINPRSFAYPNNARTLETDIFLLRYFDFLRSGMKNAENLEYLTMEQLKTSGCLHGSGIGEYYHTDIDTELRKIKFASENDRFKMYFSHDIAPDATGINMPLKTLEIFLEYASQQKMRILGFDDLPRGSEKG